VAPLIGLVLVLAWIGAVVVWRYSSGGALTAFALFPVIAVFVRPTSGFIIFSLVISGLIVMKHRGNIERLWKGTESKIGQSRSG
jgi:glycerol-3-phosphate acyltransferase PlsY